MARKVKNYTIQAEGRDKGKVFVLTEMPATQGEKWALRLFLAMAKGGIDLPDNVTSAGMAGLAKIGLELLAQVPYEQAEPLLDEMMACVTCMPDPGNPSITRALVESDIEEVSTRIMLRKETFFLHVDFFPIGGQSTSAPASAARGTASVSIRTSH
jgi:hypothetical protein